MAILIFGSICDSTGFEECRLLKTASYELLIVLYIFKEIFRGLLEKHFLNRAVSKCNYCIEHVKFGFCACLDSCMCKTAKTCATLSATDIL